ITPAMEAARLIMAAGGKPQRTILVCLWAGEEFGLWGSKSWVQRNKIKLDNNLERLKTIGENIETDLKSIESYEKNKNELGKNLDSISEKCKKKESEYQANLNIKSSLEEKISESINAK
ncbi:MAG: M28 family peptidase, partial [Ignavibacteriae bacterium]|nr:M28 family peptidase [Ignavibacteriota bacterium]